MAQNLIIVGASARAAAWSALRAGFAPWAVDLFADRDLSRLVPARAVAPPDYPHGLIWALADAPAAPWCYTGALENRPGLVGRISRTFPLWGNGPAVLRRVRSPFNLAESLRLAGLPSPAVSRTGDNKRRWLMKPFASAAGRGILCWDGQQEVRRGWYLQEWIDGAACAAVYLGQADGGASLIGVTRQLLGGGEKGRKGEGENAAVSGFCYSGSVGPLPLTARPRDVYQRLGDTLVRDFGLRGLFGVDCVVREGVPWAVEVNPRYTASMEILEWARHLPLLALQSSVFGAQTVMPKTFIALHPPTPPPATNFFGKAIAHAEDSGVFPEEGPWNDVLAKPWSPWEMPEFADIPRAGERFEVGQPILTVFARGDSVDECVSGLQQRVQRVKLVPRNSACGLASPNAVRR